jgi:hypothetical protein
MRTTAAISRIVFLLSLLTYIGCEPPSARRSISEGGSKVDIKSPTRIDKTTDAQGYSGYMPAKVDIMPLTEFVPVPHAEGSSKLRIYVGLLDSFNCQMKSPGVFRFELYEGVLRSAEPKGRRIILWPDIDLTNAAKNNQCWRDFLRAYEFNLDFEPKASQNYILQATFLSTAGRRLSDDFNLKSR